MNIRFGMAAVLVIGIIVIVLFVTRAQSQVGMVGESATHGESMQEEVMQGDVMVKEGTMEDKARDEQMMKEVGTKTEEKSGAMMASYKGAVLAGVSAPLIEYNKADYDAAVASGKLVVLYFYANWCPICKAEFPLMQAAFDGLTSERVVGFRVSYKDSETDKDEEALARQFGVPYQHTKVFVRNGAQILKSPDGWDKDRYEAEITKALEQ